MTLEEKIRRLPPERRKIIERLVDILLSGTGVSQSDVMEEFKKLRGILMDKIKAGDSVRL